MLTRYSKDQVTADLWLLQRSVNYTLLSIAVCFVRVLFAKNRVKSSHGFCYGDDLDKMVCKKLLKIYLIPVVTRENICCQVHLLFWALRESLPQLQRHVGEDSFILAKLP